MIAGIISIICSSVILLSYFNRTYIDRFFMKDKLHSNVNSGINLLLADKNIVGKNETKKISLFDDENDIVD